MDNKDGRMKFFSEIQDILIGKIIGEWRICMKCKTYWLVATVSSQMTCNRCLQKKYEHALVLVSK